MRKHLPGLGFRSTPTAFDQEFRSPNPVVIIRSEMLPADLSLGSGGVSEDKSCNYEGWGMRWESFGATGCSRFDLAAPRGWGGEDLAAFPRREPSIVPLPQDESHSEWVSCVRFSPNSSNPIIVSCGWDKLVKVRWDLLPGQRALL